MTKFATNACASSCLPPPVRRVRCPHCGWDAAIFKTRLEADALYEKEAHCPSCDKTAPAEMWLRTVLLIEEKEKT